MSCGISRSSVTNLKTDLLRRGDVVHANSGLWPVGMRSIVCALFENKVTEYVLNGVLSAKQ